MKEHNKTDTYSFENGIMESCGVMWMVRVLWHGMWNVVRYGAIPGSGGGVLICDARERYVKHGSGMWN